MGIGIFKLYRKIIFYIECDLIAHTHTHTHTHTHIHAHPATHRILEINRLKYQQYLPPPPSETTSDLNFFLINN